MDQPLSGDDLLTVIREDIARLHQAGRSMRLLSVDRIDSVFIFHTLTEGHQPQDFRLEESTARTFYEQTLKIPSDHPPIPHES